MTLPASINPQPANFYNPFLVDVPPDPNVPLPAAMPTVPPPSNPMMPFVAPMMPPVCPFSNACADPNSFDCVGYNSWGFAEARLADYSPAAAHLNSASCDYFMKPYALFKVPDKMAALWHLNVKLGKVFNAYAEPLVLKCRKEDVTSPTWEGWCQEQVKTRGVPCSIDWTNFTMRLDNKDCQAAPPLDGFDARSRIAEVCPLECGWKKGMIRWPPFLSDAEEAERMKKDKKLL